MKVEVVAKALEDRVANSEKLKEDVLRKVANKMKEAGYRDLTKVFEYLDDDQSGVLDRAELDEGLKRMKVTLSVSLIKNLFIVLDKNSDNKISLKEFEKVLSKFDFKNITPKPNVYLGGPVDLDKGFVIHQNDYEINGTIEVSKNISLTSNLKIISDILDGNGPNNFRFVLGYSGWGPGQLESELKHGDWMILPADQRLIFDTPDNIMWKTAYIKLGINISDFGGQSGIS